MWTAQLINKEQRPTELAVTIQYTNGTESFTEVKTTNGGFGTVEQLKEQVKERLDILNNQTAVADALTIGEVPAPTADVTVAKTADQIAFETFMLDYSKWLRVKTLIDVGVLTGTEAAVVALLNKVKSEFKATYINNL